MRIRHCLPKTDVVSFHLGFLLSVQKVANTLLLDDRIVVVFFLMLVLVDARCERHVLQLLFVALTLLFLHFSITAFLPFQISNIERLVVSGGGTQPATDIGAEGAALNFFLITASLSFVLKLHLPVLH